MQEYLTFTQWPLRGRTVRKGEKADYYLTDESRTEGFAVFREDQTEPIEESTGHLDLLVPADEWRTRNHRPPQPKLKIKPWKDGVAIWVGNDKRLIAAVQQADYWFDGRSRRWYHRQRDLPTVVQSFREWDPNLLVEVDG